MDVDLEIEIFDSSCKTALALDDTVSVNELIEYIQQTFQEKFNGVDIQKLQIRIGGTDEMVIPSQKSLNEILRGQKKAKLFLLKNQIANLGGPPIPNQNSLQIHQSMPQNQNLNRQNPMEQQGTLTRNQNQPQNPIPQNQLQNSQFGRIINVNVKSGMQQIQVQLDDSVTIRDVIQNFQENMNIDLQSYHLYYGLQNLSLLNQNLTLKQLGMQNQSYLEWKHISQINQNQLNQQTNYNQRVQQPPMVMQSNIQGQNLPGQTQYNPQFNGQQANMPFQQQQFLYQQQQQQQQLLFQQQQQQQQQFQTQQQQQQQYNQINTTNQQQGYQGQPGQQQVNTTQTSPMQVQKPGKQINVSFEILDGNIKRQFSTITNTNNTLSELLDAVYQYLGISKEVASIDLWIGPTPFGGPKLLLSLEQLQMTKDNQTFTVKVRWIGG